MTGRPGSGRPGSGRAAGPAVTVSAPPATLLTAAAVVALEALVLAAFAVGLAVYQLLGHRPHDPVASWLLVGLAALGSGLLVWACRGLLQGANWARSMATLAQLLVLPLGGNALSVHAPVVGIPLVFAGIVGLVGLFAPSSTRIFSAR